MDEKINTAIKNIFSFTTKLERPITFIKSANFTYKQKKKKKGKSRKKEKKKIKKNKTEKHKIQNGNGNMNFGTMKNMNFGTMKNMNFGTMKKYTQKAGSSKLGKCFFELLPNNNIKLILGRRRYVTKYFNTNSVARKLLLEIANDPERKNGCIRIAKNLDIKLKQLAKENRKNK
jgi:hypothetical protein